LRGYVVQHTLNVGISNSPTNWRLIVQDWHANLS
jgi:hypothetical protein